MNMLAIDTATEILSVALSCKKGTFSSNIDAGEAHSEYLFTLIDQAFKTADIEASDIDLFVCSRGPGSWTGLRVGFSTVKGFALALNKPYVSVPALDTIAHCAACFKGVIIPVLDARRKRFFCALYEGKNRLTEYLDALPEEVSALVPPGRDVLLTGNGAEMFMPLFQPLVKNKVILDCRYRRARADDILDYINKNPSILDTRELVSSAPIYLREGV